MQKTFRVSLSRHIPASLPMLLCFLPPFLSLKASGVEYRCLLFREGKKQHVGGVAWPSQLSHTDHTTIAAMLCPAPSDSPEDVGKRWKKQGENKEVECRREKGRRMEECVKEMEGDKTG